MDLVTVFSATGGNGFGPAMSGLRLAARFVLWCYIFLIPASVVAAQAVSHPATGGSSSGILPVSLGRPAECAFTSSYAMNSGRFSGDLVVAGSVNCGDDYGIPAQWRDHSWSFLDMPEGPYAGGYAESVNDNPSAEPIFTYHILDQEEGEYGGWDTFVLSPGHAPAELSLLPDMTHIGRAVLSAQGNHVVGGNSAGGTVRAVRWTRDGDSWLPPEDLGVGVAVATTEDGSIVIGNGNGETWGFMDGSPWVWTANAEGGGQMTSLEPEAMVHDITHSGSMIVGSRPQPCAGTQCDFSPAPVYWVVEGGQWTMHDLEVLEGMESNAFAVAEVNGRPIILGDSAAFQPEWISDSVVWLPAADGSYGAPLRLEALDAIPGSFTYPLDINRSGLVLGWSEIEPWGDTFDVVWNLSGLLPFEINGGISDAWYDPETDGQGFFIMVSPSSRTIFMAWFTYDTERPDGSASAALGDPGHRWLTAQGTYADDTAELEITMTEGGIFDAGSPVPVRRSDGTMTLKFSDCVSGTVSYDIPSIGRQGVVPIQRVSQDNVANCEKLAMPMR